MASHRTDEAQLSKEGDIVGVSKHWHIAFFSAPSPSEDPSNSNGWLCSLPIEVAVIVLNKCDLKTQVALFDTCKILRAAIQNEKTLSYRCEKQFPEIHKSLKAVVPEPWNFSSRSSRLAYRAMLDKQFELTAEEGSNNDACAVLDAMKRFYKEPHVADSICFLLRRMCFREVDANSHNKKFFSAGGAIDLLFYHLHSHLRCNNIPIDVTEDERLSAARNAIASLNNLALDEENKRLIVAYKDGVVIQDILNAMLEHPRDEKLQEYACSALWGVGIHGPNKSKLVGVKDTIVGIYDGIDLIIRAMLLLPDCYQVLRDACSGLWELSLNTKVAELICLKGGVEIIMEMMNRQIDKAIVAGDEGALSMIIDAIPATRVISTQYFDAAFHNDDDEELDDDDVEENAEAVALVEKVFQLDFSIAKRMLAIDPPDKAKASFFHLLDEILISLNALTTDEFFDDIGAVMQLGIEVFQFAKKHNTEKEANLALSISIFLCDLLKFDEQPFDLILESGIFKILADALMDISNEMRSAPEVKIELAKDRKQWRLAEFFGYCFEQCTAHAAKHSFFQDLAFLARLTDVLACTVVGCLRHSYKEGLHYCYPAIYQLLQRDFEQETLLKALKANSSFTEALRQTLVLTRKGDIPPDGRVADYCRRIMDKLRM